MQHSNITTKEAKRQATELVQTYGWQIFYRGLGAALGAATLASLLGGRKTMSMRKYGNEQHTEETSRSEIGGKVRAATIAAGAIGGAAYPAAAIIAATSMGVWKVWRTMNPESRAKAVEAMAKAKDEIKSRIPKK